MLYSEFIDGTGCRTTEHNYKVYKDLEIMYVNSDLTKEQIYEYGKKLVDNTPGPEEIARREAWKAEIAEHKEQIRSYRDFIKSEKELAEFIGRDVNKDLLKYYREQIRYHKNMIDGLKFCLSFN